MCLRQFKRFALLSVLALILGACALSPKKAESRIASDELLARQLDSVQKSLEQMPPDQRAVLYIGSAQHSQSLAFQRDVLLVQTKLKTINPNVQSIILSNEQKTSQLVYPFATLHTLKQTFDRVAVWSKTHPLTLVLLVATHGNVDVLASNVANTHFTPIQSKHLRPWMDALGNTPTIVILSACHSGSFVEPLEASNRIVLAAAAANRNSFGCAYHDDNTHFIGELFGRSFDPAQTWQQNFDVARTGIETKEKSSNVSPPSNPQSSVPSSLADKSINDFLRP